MVSTLHDLWVFFFFVKNGILIRKLAKKKKFNAIFPYSLLHISVMIWWATEQVKQDCWIRVYLILACEMLFSLAGESLTRLEFMIL